MAFPKRRRKRDQGHRRSRAAAPLAPLVLLACSAFFECPRSTKAMNPGRHEVWEGMERRAVLAGSEAAGESNGDVNLNVDTHGGYAENSTFEAKESLPRCYSSPTADPSKGTWRKTEYGAESALSNMLGWDFSEKEFGREPTCVYAWRDDHTGEGPMPYYTWDAERCSLAELDPGKFCRVMEGRKGLLFVGDSLNREMAETLASILRAKTIVAGGERRCYDTYLACDGKLNIDFQRSDWLDARSEPPFNDNFCEIPNRSGALCTVFADDDTLSRFDTLVVNSGAHWRPADVYGPALENASDAITGSMKRLHGDDAILVVRNTVPGHGNCSDKMFGGPVDAETALSLVETGNLNYRWNRFHEENPLLEAAFNQAKGWRLLDAYTPTIVRVDSHKGADCLHYCIPGPIDHWVRLLYNMLLVATSFDDGVV